MEQTRELSREYHFYGWSHLEISELLELFNQSLSREYWGELSGDNTLKLCDDENRKTCENVYGFCGIEKGKLLEKMYRDKFGFHLSNDIPSQEERSKFYRRYEPKSKEETKCFLKSCRQVVFSIKVAEFVGKEQKKGIPFGKHLRRIQRKNENK